MGKIKVNLASGNVVEKPLITCFQGNTGSYIVLDNETNGSMGLPVICISKFVSNTAQKITDPNEWAAVKENLKTIISGIALPYLSVPESISATDDFYTQLTLPLASFDLLKNVYAPVQATPVETIAPVAPEIPAAAPSVPVTPVMPNAIAMPTDVVQAPVSAPVVADPVAAITPDAIAPVTPIVPETVAPVVPAAPVIPEATILEPTTLNSAPAAPSVSSNDIEAIKDNFMKSCENMFDALIQQFNIK